MIEIPLAWHKTLELTEVIKKRKNLIPISMITNGSGKGLENWREFSRWALELEVDSAETKKYSAKKNLKIEIW